ncbi:A24 family peptidase [Aerococcus sp. UMB7834]|uniref:prepilin peptidase n=1 Tax=Aerococcus sp. UMB7834 TaxID=3046342 RepID=UPI00254FBA98|nr:A24 family peptidase [Aerococcus sp. UMB7834]MDK6804644.1 prepilin peptidase [Aerococcus sp. UMB7834]
MLMLSQIYLFFALACLASFLMLWAYRTIHSGAIIWGRSQCDHCQARLPYWALCPILGYLLCRGRCQVCRTPVPLYYPLIEALFACTAFYLISQEAYSDLVILAILTLMTATDLTALVVPDRFQVLLFFACLAREETWQLERWLQALALCLALYALNQVIKEGLGGADIKLFTSLCLAYGLAASLEIIFLSSGLALAYFFLSRQAKHHPLPFVPFISLAVIILLLFP